LNYSLLGIILTGMKISFELLRQKLGDSGLKVTPQRLAVLEAILKLNSHPTADKIIEEVHKKHPGIATGTVYHILDIFSVKGLLKKVKTDNDAMRYDAIHENHHHLYSEESERIEDYFDEDLDKLLENYFSLKQIRNFEVRDIKLQLIGKFKQP
jgi:Fur family transcriptional regulator, peroxide stress response regulator